MGTHCADILFVDYGRALADYGAVERHGEREGFPERDDAGRPSVSC